MTEQQVALQEKKELSPAEEREIFLHAVKLAAAADTKAGVDRRS